MDLSDRSYVRIEGFRLRGFRTNVPGQVPVGVLIQGSSVGVEIVDNVIEDMGAISPVDDDLLGRDAHGVAVYGNSADATMDTFIRGNELRALSLGSSEAMVLNGNVSNFVVLENHVHDCDNIGIDIIGFEGTAPPGAIDQARDGVVVGNRVHDCSSAGNPPTELRLVLEVYMLMVVAIFCCPGIMSSVVILALRWHPST